MNKTYDKLVRDKIIDKILEDPRNKVEFRTVTGEELYKYRQKKVIEELEELKTAVDYSDVYLATDMLEELTDVVEALWYLLYGRAVTKDELITFYDVFVAPKREHKGAFDKNLILKGVKSDEE